MHFRQTEQHGHRDENKNTYDQFEVTGVKRMWGELDLHPGSNRTPAKCFTVGNWCSQTWFLEAQPGSILEHRQEVAQTS